MAFLYSLFLILLPTMLVVIAILTIALFHWRKHPNFIAAMNFKRPFWLALFISLGVIALGFAGVTLTPAIFHFFHIHYEKLGLQDLTCIAFLLLMFLGALCSEVSAVCCIWRLIAAILSYVHSRQPKQSKMN